MTRQQLRPPPALQLAYRHHHAALGEFTDHLQISRTRRPSCHTPLQPREVPSLKQFRLWLTGHQHHPAPVNPEEPDRP